MEPDGAFSIAELMLNIQKSVTYVLNQECYLCFDCARSFGIRNPEYGIRNRMTLDCYALNMSEGGSV